MPQSNANNAPGTDPLRSAADAPSLSAPDFASEPNVNSTSGRKSDDKETNQKTPIPLRNRLK
jgi:hypothetical protein